ncbi:MAG: hypothetical protein ACI93S_000527 [Ancylomarina sp.]|jgi:hypothetical protein
MSFMLRAAIHQLQLFFYVIDIFESFLRQNTHRLY